MKWEEMMRFIWQEHRGKALGVILGLFFGIFTAVLGFWKTFFIAICIILGYFFGKRADEQGSLRRFLDRWFDE